MIRRTMGHRAARQNSYKLSGFRQRGHGESADSEVTDATEFLPEERVSVAFVASEEEFRT